MINKKIVLRILIFGIFIMSSIFIGFLWFLNPLSPTKWNDDPYRVNIYQLYVEANILENELTVVVEDVDDYNYNESSDILSIIIGDEPHDIQITIQFHDWSKHEKFNNIIVNIGNIYSFKGKSLLLSEGIVLGVDIVEIQSYWTNILSLVALIILFPLIFYYFKIDFKKFKLIRRGRKKSIRGS